jgi:hypothetical protein
VTFFALLVVSLLMGVFGPYAAHWFVLELDEFHSEVFAAHSGCCFAHDILVTQGGGDGYPLFNCGLCNSAEAVSVRPLPNMVSMYSSDLSHRKGLNAGIVNDSGDMGGEVVLRHLGPWVPTI